MLGLALSVHPGAPKQTQYCDPRSQFARLERTIAGTANANTSTANHPSGPPSPASAPNSVYIRVKTQGPRPTRHRGQQVPA